MLNGLKRFEHKWCRARSDWCLLWQGWTIGFHGNRKFFDQFNTYLLLKEDSVLWR